MKYDTGKKVSALLLAGMLTVSGMGVFAADTTQSAADSETIDWNQLYNDIAKANAAEGTDDSGTDYAAALEDTDYPAIGKNIPDKVIQNKKSSWNGLNAARSRQNGVRLSYNSKQVKKAEGVTICRQYKKGGKWIVVDSWFTDGTKAGSSHTDTSTANGHLYRYKIILTNGDSTYRVSNVKRGMWLRPVSLKSATTVTNGKTGTLALSWEKNSKADGYQVLYGIRGSESTGLQRVKGTSVTLNKLESGKTYSIRVRAYRKVGGRTYYSTSSEKMEIAVK